MINIIRDITDPLLDFMGDDPVRPHIPVTQRVGDHKDIFVLKEGDCVKAITCVSYQEQVPENESDLFTPVSLPAVAVFYTIWSYASGAGRELLMSAVERIMQEHPEINRFVTLSPKTDMARRFHLKNGACVLRENPSTVNYEYLMGDHYGLH